MHSHRRLSLPCNKFQPDLYFKRNGRIFISYLITPKHWTLPLFQLSKTFWLLPRTIHESCGAKRMWSYQVSTLTNKYKNKKHLGCWNISRTFFINTELTGTRQKNTFWVMYIKNIKVKHSSLLVIWARYISLITSNNYVQISLYKFVLLKEKHTYIKETGSGDTMKHLKQLTKVILYTWNVGEVCQRIWMLLWLGPMVS